MVCGPQVSVLRDSGKYPCGVCRKGVASNSICCHGRSHWIHKTFTSIRGKLIPVPTFRFSRCFRTARPIDGRPYGHVVDGGHTLEGLLLLSGDTISAGGGCKLATIARVRAAWVNLRELLPLIPWPWKNL